MLFCKNKTKRILLLLTCLVLVATVFVGCVPNNPGPNDDPGGGDNPDGDNPGGEPFLGNLSGTEIAKLLLANQRLDANKLNKGNIFADGSQTLNKLARRAARRVATVDVPASEQLGNFSVSNGEATWSDFAEYNNSYSYFQNITDLIVNTAKQGAELIDFVKENVSFVDVWLNFGYEKYYLSVNENSETLCRSDSDGIFVCKRYTDENGKTVYELLNAQSFSTRRVKYIPDERYEFSELMPSVQQELYFVADHSKGYWETFCANTGGELYNERFTILKNDVAYMFDYNAAFQSVGTLGVMSADAATEFFRISNVGSAGSINMEMQFAGFDGIAKAVASASYVDDNGNLTDFEKATVHLDNGKTVKVGDTFADGTVEIGGIHLNALADGYFGSFDVTVSGNSDDEIWANFSKFLQETGMECRRPWEDVFNSIPVANADAENLVQYYQWNGNSIATLEDITAGVAVESARIDAIKDIYEQIKDTESVDMGEATEEVDLDSFNFATIGEAAFTGATVNGKTVIIGAIQLTVSDTTLFVEETAYNVVLALTADGKDIVAVSKGEVNVYGGGDSFTVSAQSLQFDLPQFSDGEYTVVAYVATDDGIRVSELTVAEFDEVAVGDGDFGFSVQHNDNNAISIEYQNQTDHYVRIECIALEYPEFLKTVSTSVFVYGTPSGKLEKLTDGDYVEVAENGEILDGTYRMSYTVSNGDNVTGYVYVEYVIIAE